jgi:AraC-like DNA-binding protein
MEEEDPLVSSLYVTDIGHYPMAEHHHRSRHEAINQYVLIYCIDGCGWYMLDGKRHEVSRDNYFILPPGVPHEYGATEGKRWTIYWVHFSGEHAAVYSEGAQLPQQISPSMNSRISERNNIFEEILYTLHYGEGIEDLRYASSLLHYYLASLRYLRQYQNRSKMDNSHSNRPFVNSTNVDVVEAAIHYMRENLERRITLKDVIDYVGYSSSYFSALFKKEKGCSPLVYFNRMKIEYACHMMKTTDLHINQICYKIGFEDNLYFSRLFSKTMGISPKAWRDREARQ